MDCDETDTVNDEKLTDLSNYQIDTYKDWHLGMRGQRTGRYFAGIDDFDLIYPKFDTNIMNRVGNSVDIFDEMIISGINFGRIIFYLHIQYDGTYCKTQLIISNHWMLPQT